MSIERILKKIYLSKNFTAFEFCNAEDGFDIEVPDISLFNKLQKLRDTIKVPIKINSGFRTEDYNKKIGGDSNSYHLAGLAVDVEFETMNKYSQSQLLDILSSCGFSNVGIYYKNKNVQWLHLDIGKKWDAWKTYKALKFKTYQL